MESESTKALVERHVAAWQRGDIPSLLADYADNAVMLNVAMGVVAGRAAIGEMLAQVFAGLFPPGDTTMTVDGMLTTDDNALIHYTATTSSVRTSGAFDAFTLRDGKIVTQFSGGELVPVA